MLLLPLKIDDQSHKAFSGFPQAGSDFIVGLEWHLSIYETTPSLVFVKFLTVIQ